MMRVSKETLYFFVSHCSDFLLHCTLTWLTASRRPVGSVVDLPDAGESANAPLATYDSNKVLDLKISHLRQYTKPE